MHALGERLPPPAAACAGAGSCALHLPLRPRQLFALSPGRLSLQCFMASAICFTRACFMVFMSCTPEPKGFSQLSTL